MKIVTLTPVGGGEAPIIASTSDTSLAIRDIPNGTYDMYVESDNYEDVTQRVYINGDTRMQVHLYNEENLSVNLLMPDMMRFRWGGEKYENGEQAPTQDITETSVLQVHIWDNGGGFNINSTALQPNREYTLIFEYQKHSGSLTTIGGEAEFMWQNNVVFIDGVQQSEPWNTGINFDVTDDAERHEIKIHVTIPDYGADDNHIQIQPNYLDFKNTVLTFYGLAIRDGHI